jgi:hypothetical protein
LTSNQLKAKQFSMSARKQHLFAAVPVDPPSEWLQESLLEKYDGKSTKVQQDENHEDRSLTVGSPVLANIQECSFLLGLMIGFFVESSALSAHVLVVAMIGDYVDPNMVTLLSILWSAFTSVLPFITLRFIRSLVSLIYIIMGDTSEEKKTLIIWHIECRFGFGTLMGVCSASILMDLLIGMDGHIKYSVGMFVCAMILSIIFHCCYGGKHRQVTIFGQSVQAPSANSSRRDCVDPTEMWCGAVQPGALLIV